MSRGSEVRQKTTKNWYQERSCDEAWCLVTGLQHNRQWAVEVFIYLSCYVFLLISIDQLTARQFITFIPHWTSCCTLKHSSCPMLRKPSFTNYILQSSKVPFPISLLLYIMPYWWHAELPDRSTLIGTKKWTNLRFLTKLWSLHF